MTRLQHEWQRLYAPAAPSTPAEGAGQDRASDPAAAPAAAPADIPAADPRPERNPLLDAQGRVRALVMALGQPADWSSLARVWQGVQADLGWPAPAIAVNGVDAVQLWFSLAQPVPVARAAALLQALRQRYLADVPEHRLALLPAAAAGGAEPFRHAAQVPARQANCERWSAFVAPDLAAMFADEPWLAVCPNPEGQAKLLAALASTPLLDLARAEPAAAAAQPDGDQPAVRVPAAQAKQAEQAAAPEGLPGRTMAAHVGPKQFLQDVMHNPDLPWALRVDAAKALLPYLEPPAAA